MSLQEYRNFINSKGGIIAAMGFPPVDLNANAKTHQKATIEFALEKGKSAAFLDTGLGKSFIELEFAKECAIETKKPTLILTPLAVAATLYKAGRCCIGPVQRYRVDWL